MSIGPKEKIHKELKEIRKILHEQNENINRNRNYKELNKIKELKNSVEEFNNRYEQAVERVNELKDG